MLGRARVGPRDHRRARCLHDVEQGAHVLRIVVLVFVPAEGHATRQWAGWTHFLSTGHDFHPSGGSVNTPKITLPHKVIVLLRYYSPFLRKLVRSWLAAVLDLLSSSENRDGNRQPAVGTFGQIRGTNKNNGPPSRPGGRKSHLTYTNLDMAANHVSWHNATCVYATYACASDYHAPRIMPPKS